MSAEATEGNTETHIKAQGPQVTLRKPESSDGARVHKLISECKPLDENSTYCNLLQCTHFADTCVAAEDKDGNLVGFISGYIPPKQTNVLFIWQVAVHQSARGLGLAKRMLADIIEREECDDVQFIETTITADNEADRKSTRLNSSHVAISYAVFCLKKQNKQDSRKPQQQ